MKKQNRSFFAVTCFISLFIFQSIARSSWEFLGPEGATNAGQFVLSQKNPNTIYARESDSVFKTTNAGKSWQRLPNAPRYVLAFALSYSQKDVLYAVGIPPLSDNNALALSIDGGERWEVMPLPKKEGRFLYQLSDIAVHPKDNMKLLGVWGDAYQSVDGGHHWVRVKIGLKNQIRPDEPNFGLERIAIDPKHPSIIYTAGMWGVLKSTDGGNTWQKINLGFDISKKQGIDVSDIIIDPNIKGVVYLSVNGEILGTKDGGKTWRNLTAGKFERNPRFVEVAISPDNSAHLYAAGEEGIFQSQDGGERWQQIWTGQKVKDIAVNPKNPDQIYASVDNIGFIRSDDRGKTFNQKNRGMDAVYLTAVSVSRSNPPLIYTGGQGFYRSSNGGKTWQLTGWDFGELRSEIVIHPENDKVIYVCGNEKKETAKSEDGGETWTFLTSVNKAITHLTIDPKHPTRLYASTVAGPINLERLYRSRDSGKTWEEITPSSIPIPGPFSYCSLANVVFHPKDSNIIFLGHCAGVSRSNDGGKSWKDVSNGLAGDVQFIAIDPKNSELLFAVDSESVYRTKNGGERWEKKARIPAHFIERRIAISPQGAETAVFVATRHRVWMSTDGGNNFKLINDNLPNLYIGEIVTHPAEIKTVLVATNRGLFRYRADTVAVYPKNQKLTSWGKIKQIKLLQNYPNPSNTETWIPYQLAKDADVIIHIYSVSGQLVRTLDLGNQPSGIYVTKDKAAFWDGKTESGNPVASGVYFYTLEASGKKIGAHKMIMLK